MKREMDLIREMLIWMENHEDRLIIYNEFKLFRDDWEITIGHLAMLISAGFVDEPSKNCLRITWDGYEFLEKIRDPEIWTETKKGAAKVGSWSVKLLSEIAGGLIRAKAAELGILPG